MHKTGNEEFDEKIDKFDRTVGGILISIALSVVTAILTVLLATGQL